MDFDIKIFNGENALDYLVLNRPYHPANPALLLLTEGTFAFTENLSEILLKENSVFMIDPKKVYEITSVSPDIDMAFVILSRDFMKRLPLKIDRSKIFVQLRSKDSIQFELDPAVFQQMRSTAELLFSYITQKGISLHQEEIIQHLVSALLYQFAAMMNEREQAQAKAGSRKDEITFSFLRDASEYFFTEREIGFYAGRQNITTRHLSAVLRDVTGQTAGQILSKFLIREAKALLCCTEKSVYEIASDLRFSDQYAFSHFFKKHIAESPMAYRRKFKI